MKETFRTSDGLEIAYFVDDFTKPWAPGDTIIMLHSAMGHSGRYFSMVAPLLLDYRVVRMDLRGHGQSQVPPEEPPLTMERLVQDVVEMMDHIGCDSAHFIGNSAGGYVSQQMAMNHAGRVRSLSLFGSTPGLKQSDARSWLPRIAEMGLRPFLAETIEYRFDPDRTEPGLIEWFLDEAAKNDVPYIARFVTLMTSLYWGDELHRITCPTLVVIPGRETVGNVRNYDAMRDNIPDVVLKYCEGMPHNICDAMPRECAAYVLDFLGDRFAST